MAINCSIDYFKRRIGVEPQVLRIIELEIDALKKANHSQQFLEIVESILPDYRKEKNGLD